VEHETQPRALFSACQVVQRAQALRGRVDGGLARSERANGGEEGVNVEREQRGVEQADDVARSELRLEQSAHL
jgi:hypothetical protein